MTNGSLDLFQKEKLPHSHAANIPVVYFGILVPAILARGAGEEVVLRVHVIPYSDRVRYWKLCTVQGVVGKSGERGSQNLYVSCSQEFAVLLLTP